MHTIKKEPHLIKERMKKNGEFMNKLYYMEEGELIGEMLMDKQVVEYIKHMRTIYYTIDTLDFQSIVFDSMWTTVKNKGSIESKAHLINYFKRTLKNNLINKLKYDQRAKRSIEEDMEIPYAENEEEISGIESDYQRQEILLFLRQENIHPNIIRYAELLMDSNTPPTDMECSRVLQCNRKTIKKYKTQLQTILKEYYIQ